MKEGVGREEIETLVKREGTERKVEREGIERRGGVGGGVKGESG